MTWAARCYACLVFPPDRVQIAGLPPVSALLAGNCRKLLHFAMSSRLYFTKTAINRAFVNITGRGSAKYFLRPLKVLYSSWPRMCCTGRAKYNDATDSLRQLFDAVTRGSFVSVLERAKRVPGEVATKNAADPEAERRTVMRGCELMGLMVSVVQYPFYAVRTLRQQIFCDSPARPLPGATLCERKNALKSRGAYFQTRRVLTF